MEAGHTESARLLYSLRREKTYYFLTFVLLVFGVVTTWLSSLLTPETVREEFGASAAVSVIRAIFLVVGWSGLLAWLWWMRRYVRRLTWLPRERLLVVERFGWPGREHRVPLAAVAAVSAHDGVTRLPGAPSVHAPYRRLHLEGLPSLILDDQGETHDAAALEAILIGREPEHR